PGEHDGAAQLGRPTAIGAELLVVAGDDEGGARRRGLGPERQQGIHAFPPEAGADAEDDRLLGRDAELAPHPPAAAAPPPRMEALDVDAVAHDRDVAGRHARVRRQDLVAGALRHGEDGAVAAGSVLAPLDREERTLIRTQPAQACRAALLRDPAL